MWFWEVRNKDKHIAHTYNKFHILNDTNIHMHRWQYNAESASRQDYPHNTLLIILKER